MQTNAEQPTKYTIRNIGKEISDGLVAFYLLSAIDAVILYSVFTRVYHTTHGSIPQTITHFPRLSNSPTLRDFKAALTFLFDASTWRKGKF